MEKYDISSTDTAIENKVYEYAVDYTNEKGLLENIVVFSEFRLKHNTTIQSCGS